MDAWTTKYLQSWADDFGDEPNFKQSLQFLDDVMSKLKELSDSKSTKTTTASPGAVASSIITYIKSQQNPEVALEDLQAVIFEAVISSSLSTIDLAAVTRSLVDNLPGPLSKKFELQLASNTRERWNGPDKPSSSKGMDQCVEEWVSLNTFVAHLTRVHAAPLEDYALRTLNRAFGPGVDLNEKVYHVPAAAAWMDILGEDIYLWSSQSSRDNRPSGFRLHKWHEWKRGFETYSNSDDLHPQAKGRAEMAFCKMKTLETTGTCH
ncbi:hypothetical protein N7475_000262 [Penicillium sp. IBT 31633x]|nr:hypothetical protein N7475_000262 [Penicillium sp. IBT 31633x]